MVDVRVGDHHHVQSVDAGALEITELFSCPDRDRPLVVREIALRNSGAAPVPFLVRAGIGGLSVERSGSGAPGETAKFALLYTLDAGLRSVAVGWSVRSFGSESAATYHKSLASVATGDPLLDRFFKASRSQLPAVVSRTGRLDGSIWQYNREWVRDQSVIAERLRTELLVKPKVELVPPGTLPVSEGKAKRVIDHRTL